jgi:ATP synthase protein I
MMTYYGRVVRWSIPLTSVVAAAAVVICALMSGSKGAYSALVGVGVVAIFFAISLFVVGHFARVNPMAMMVAALASFVVKIVAFMVVLAVVRHIATFDGRMLGFTALACILAWSAAQIGVAMKLNFPYVEPDGQS